MITRPSKSLNIPQSPAATYISRPLMIVSKTQRPYVQLLKTHSIDRYFETPWRPFDVVVMFQCPEKIHYPCIYVCVCVKVHVCFIRAILHIHHGHVQLSPSSTHSWAWSLPIWEDIANATSSLIGREIGQQYRETHTGLIAWCTRLTVIRMVYMISKFA